MILITIAVHVARVEVLGLGRVALLDWLSTVGAAVGRSLGCLLLISWSLAIRLLWLTIGSGGLSVRWLWLTILILTISIGRSVGVVGRRVLNVAAISAVSVLSGSSWSSTIQVGGLLAVGGGGSGGGLRLAISAVDRLRALLLAIR